MNNSFILSVSDLQIGYPSLPLLAEHLNFSIEGNQMWAIVGPNGSGKTTLVKTILGLIKPRKGNINRMQNLRIGYVPQRAQVDPVFPASTLDVVLMGCTSVAGPFRRINKAQKEMALNLLERVGLTNLASKPFRNLSGGQRQRAMIARALAVQPNLLILDEPTDGMDLGGEADLINLLEEIRIEKNMPIMIVTHSLQYASTHAEHLILFYGENNQTEIGTTSQLLTPESLKKIYGRDVAVKELDGVTVVYLPVRKKSG